MSLPFVRRERHALCETALELGPDEPTLCEGWTVRDLIAHLLVRESPSIGAAGIAIPLMSGFTERAMAAAARQPFETMVHRLRDPGWTPYRLPGVERVANTLEYFVHHEDLRRAQAGWQPRDLPATDQDEVWRLFRIPAKLAARKAGIPLILRRLGPAGPHQEMRIRGGDDPVTVTGPAPELVLAFFGRDQVRAIDWDGPPDAIARLRASLSGRGQ